MYILKIFQFEHFSKNNDLAFEANGAMSHIELFCNNFFGKQCPNFIFKSCLKICKLNDESFHKKKCFCRGISPILRTS